MANVQHPGFAPFMNGAETVELVRMVVLSNNTDRICKGDALDGVSTGDVIAHTTEDGEVHSVQWGGASYVSGGVRLERQALPAATTYSGTAPGSSNTSFVYGVENTSKVRFRASIDEAVVLTGQGINYKMVLTVGTGNLSLHELDATTPADTATFPWRVHELILGDPKVDHTLADAHVICRINAGRRDPALEVSGSMGT